MATTTLAKKQQKITVPANTDEHDINFDAVLDNVFGSPFAYALVTMVSGTAVQFDSNGVTIDSSSPTLSASGNNIKDIFEIRKGTKLKYKGGAGSEVFNISIIQENSR